MPTKPRCVALVGPFQSGKTALFEAILKRAGAAGPGGRGEAKSVGDPSPEARAHQLSVEAVAATVDYLGDAYTFIDCPGSVEFSHAASLVLPACDVAVVVCEADERKTPQLEEVLRELEELGVPHLLFLNKIDAATGDVREALAELQKASRAPLMLRQLPIVTDGRVTGFVDLALDRAFDYREGDVSRTSDLPPAEVPHETEERFHLLETLADHDDRLMEDLIMEVEPEPGRIFADLTSELRENHAVSVLIGSAARENGITRLLKALRHEAPGIAETRARLGFAGEGPALAYAMKTAHPSFGGKITMARVLRGAFREGEDAIGAGGDARIAGLVSLFGEQTTRRGEAGEGEVAGFLKLDPVQSGAVFGAEAPREASPGPSAPAPMHAVSLHVRDRKDDVRLSAALSKLVEEDPSLFLESRPDLGELRLGGLGEMHLRVAAERLASRYQVAVTTERPGVGYRETLRAPASAHGRHRKQSGGHGQFGDVKIEVRPLERGAGFVFEDRIVGGAVPRQYIPSVETGVRAFAERGPLGAPLVDFAVALVDGSFHTVDSSDAAFQAAARIAMMEAMASAGSVLLEPILAVTVTAPASATAALTQLVSGRRGQILGYDALPGREDWIAFEALIPEAEMDGLVIQLRSATAGVGAFVSRFEKMAEAPAGSGDQSRTALRKTG
ncbi:elongation factor G [Methylopila sp. M107]|uniref:elongation factor G n=1 Tax=Methylopila sp. M107 TaxID=1101190 RepID=UPI0003A23670|nr:elongation factor G [Methylopila sp. M107]